MGRGSSRAGMATVWGRSRAGGRLCGCAIAPPLPVSPQFGPSSCAMSPVQEHPCAPAACTHAGNSTSSFGGCFPLCHSLAHFNLLSGLMYLDMLLQVTPGLASPPNPSGQHSGVLPFLSPSSLCPSDDCSQGCFYAGVIALMLCAHAQGLPVSCMSQWGCGSRAGCPCRYVGTGLAVPGGMWDQGWVAQAHSSRARWHHTCCSSFPLHENIWLEA